MKKTLFKLGFIVLCVGLIIFLLLPFLETTPPASSTLNAGKPQIVSSNPLNAIAKRLASLFSRPKERARRSLRQRDNSPTNTISSTRYAALPTQAGQTPRSTEFPADAPTQNIQVPATQQPFDYPDASFQTDNGEWVLIRQTAPQSSSPGMHEVNVHDNPYDRYIRQERTRHFGPQAAKEEIPTSKWARLTRPVMHFLGIDEPKPVQPAPIRIQQEGEKLASLGAARDKLGNVNASKGSSLPRMRMELPNITPQQWAALTEPEREQLKERQAARDFSQLISGEYMARQAAEVMANAQYPFPKNEQELKEKEEYTQRLTEENKQRIKEGLMANIEKDASQAKPVDMLNSMTGCKDASLPSSGNACTADDTFTPKTPAQLLDVVSNQNAANFLEKTNFVLPEGLPFTVVLGPTDPSTFEQMQQNPMTAPQGEIYKFLAQQKQCDSKTCFWVPNSNQPDPNLKDAISTVGKAKLYADPFNTYDSYQEAFVNYKVQQLAAKNASPEQIQQIKKLAQEQWEKHRTNWTPYAEEDIMKLNQDNAESLRAPLDKPTGKTPIFPLVADANTAVEVSQIIGPNFVYNKHPFQINSPIEAGTWFTNSIADEVNDAKQTAQTFAQDQYKQAVHMNLSSLYNQAATQSNQSGGGFQGLLNVIKGFRDNSKK